jgi:hypothetical protein
MLFCQYPLSSNKNKTLPGFHKCLIPKFSKSYISKIWSILFPSWKIKQIDVCDLVSHGNQYTKIKKKTSYLQRMHIDMLCLSNIVTYKTNIGYWYAKRIKCIDYDFMWSKLWLLLMVEDWIPTLDITLYLTLGRHIDIYASRQILYNEVFVLFCWYEPYNGKRPWIFEKCVFASSLLW